MLNFLDIPPPLRRKRGSLQDDARASRSFLVYSTSWMGRACIPFVSSPPTSWRSPTTATSTSSRSLTGRRTLSTGSRTSAAPWLSPCRAEVTSFTLGEIQVTFFLLGEIKVTFFRFGEIKVTSFTLNEIKVTSFTSGDIKVTSFTASEIKVTSFTSGGIRETP